MKTKEEILKENNLICCNCDGCLKTTEQYKKVMQDWSDQETATLREQLKEKEEEILFTDLELNQKVSLLRSCETALEERDKQLSSQSTLIESLAGALEVEGDIRTIMNLLEQFVSANSGMSVPSLKLIWNDLSNNVTKLDEALTKYNNYKNNQNGK